MSLKKSVKKFEEVYPEMTEHTEKALLFSKEQLISSERFRGRRDIVNALLSSDKQYTVEAVEQEILKYMKGKVK